MIRTMLCGSSHANDIAIIENNTYISYGDLIQRTSAIQKQLLMSNNLENIAIYLPNSSDYIAALCAVLLCGKTVVSLNAMQTPTEVATLLEHTSTYTLLTSTQLNASLQNVKDAPTDHLQDVRIIPVDACVMNEPNELVVVEVEKDTPMFLTSTSGSTGNIKIVELSEKNIEASLLGLIDKLQWDNSEQDKIRFILAMPFASAFGLMAISLCLIHRFPMIIMPEHFTLNVFYKMVEEYRVTHYEGGAVVPLLMDQVANRNIPYDISSLQYAGFGGSKVSAEALRRLRESNGNILFSQGYGMTEASPLIAKNISNLYEKMGSVGTAIKGVDIAIDVEGVMTREPYTEGEIIVSGDNVMLGYLNNSEGTSNVIKQGYLYTGDIGYLDEDGFVYICGRKKNIIIVRGFNVFPEEIEGSILNSSLAKDCVVYGDMEASGNEIICADIVPIHSEVNIEDIQLYISTNLAAYKYPQKIRFVDQIKKVAFGKNERKKHS